MPRLLPIRAVLLLFALILGISTGALPHLQFNNAPGIYFPSDSPTVVLDNQVRELFPQDQVILALFTGDSLYSDSFLEGLDRITATMSVRPDVEHVVSVVSLPHCRHRRCLCGRKAARPLGTRRPHATTAARARKQ